MLVVVALIEQVQARANVCGARSFSHKLQGQLITISFDSASALAPLVRAFNLIVVAANGGIGCSNWWSRP